MQNQPPGPQRTNTAAPQSTSAKHPEPSFREILAANGLECSVQLCDLLLTLFEQSPDALFIKDLEGKYLLCNPAVSQLVGKPVEEILGRDDTNLFDPGSAARVMARDRRVRETGLGETEEEILVTSGQTRTFQATKMPYHDSNGQLLGTVGISRDVTESRRAEEALRQSERVLQLVIDALPVGVKVIDLNGDITMANPAAERIWGMLVGPGWQRYDLAKGRWHATGLPVEDWASHRAITRGEVSHNEVIDIDAFDGQARTILNSAAPIRDSQQNILGAVIINEEITDRLRLEKQYLLNQKMEAIGQIAAGTAHDFNNLLSIISGYGELLLQDLSSDDPGRELVDEILGASKRASVLTRQLLAFSRKTVLDPSVMDLNHAVEEMQERLAKLVSKNIAVCFELAEIPCWAKVDLVQFEQLLVNLCANARDAMPSGGKLSIRTAHQEGRNGFVVVVVTDTGDGMSKDVQERIFEPFFTSKRSGQGTGLGLATVYGVMQQSGGYIEVTSSPGQGSSFHLFFPAVVNADEASQSAPAPTPSAGGKERILLVDDQDAVRTVLATALARAGYSVVQANGGHAALDLWRQGEPIDLVVTDVVMPGMSGRHLVEKLRSLEPNVKVLYMSGHTTDPTLRRGVSPTELAWLQKPFSLDALTQKIRQILDQ